MLPSFDEHDEQDPAPPVQRHAARRRRGGCLPLLVVGVVLLALVGGGLWWGKGKLETFFGDAPDFPGPGTGSVAFQVKEGDTAAAIGRSLKAEGVVKSVDAFMSAANADPKAAGIQVGYYTLKKQMSARGALDVLINPKNLVQSMVTLPEGSRVKDVVKAISTKTDIKAGDVRAALADSAAIGLPPEAEGNPEGYLYPATYAVPPKMTAVQLVSQMVAKTKEVEASLDIRTRAKALGYSVEEVMTMASLLEYEGLIKSDLPKIARVFYNRLEQDMPLQSDATVAYANNLSGTVWTTQAQRENQSPYNTYAHTGLPPGPIGSPGENTIEAALNPAKGDWLFFVPINLETGETAFASTLAEHNRNVDKLRAWCRATNSPNCN